MMQTGSFRALQEAWMKSPVKILTMKLCALPSPETMTSSFIANMLRQMRLIF